MRTTIAMTMGTMTVNDHGYMTATIAMTTTMTTIAKIIVNDYGYDGDD